MGKQVKIIIGTIGGILLLVVLFALYQARTNPSAGNPLSNLFPDIVLNNDPENQSGNGATTTTPSDQLVGISQTPIAGYVLISNGGKTIARYAELGTGNIYDYDPQAGAATKISNKMLSGVQRVLWAKDGKRFIAQSLLSDVLVTTSYTIGGANTSFVFGRNLVLGETSDDVLELQKRLNADPQTQIAQSGPGSPGNESRYFGQKTKDALKKFQEKYASDILAPSGATVGTGTFDTPTREKLNSLQQTDTDITQISLTEKRLPLGVTEITLSPDTLKIFYLISERGGGVSGYTAAFDGSNPKKIYSSSFGHLTAFWNDVNTILLTTKPSGSIAGFLYTLNPNTNSVGTILRDITGLVVQTSTNEEKIFYSRKRPENGAPELSLYNDTSGTSEVLSVRTLPEKCTWAGNTLYCAVPKTLSPHLYPDDWYKGVVHFNDTFWKIDIDSKSQEEVGAPETSPDAILLSVDNTNNILYFVNKNTLLLGVLRLQ